jgi:hypothetical protein
VAALSFALFEPLSLGLLRERAPALSALLPSGAALAVPGDSDNDTFPKNTDGFYVYPTEDCNDVNPSAHPFAPELCNGLVDDDCDGCRDESCPDGEGGTRPATCDADDDGADSLSDCNNLNASISPGATEICNNGVDDDCNGDVDGADERCVDAPDPGVSWHVLDGPESICLLDPEINPDLITIPDANPGCLPAANSGTHAWWFGGDARGSFLGDDAELPQEPKSGGTSAVGKVGKLITPAFGPVSAEGRLRFHSWWEIESVDPSRFDLMQIVALDVAGDETPIVNLNPITDPGWNQPDLHYASGYNMFLNEAAVPADPDLPPAWVDYTVALPEGTVRVAFHFDARDEFYNGYRGWLIDDVSVTDGVAPPLAAALAGPLAAAETTVFSDDLENGAPGWTRDLQVGSEDCDDCADDDGDGLIDLLDPDCGAPSALDIKTASLGLKPDENEDRVAAALSFAGEAGDIDPPNEGVAFAILDPEDPNATVACIRIPAGSPGWKTKESSWTFKDAKDASLGDPTTKETIVIKHNARKGVFDVTVRQKLAEVTNVREGALAAELVIGDALLLNQQAWTLNKKGVKLSTK